MSDHAPLQSPCRSWPPRPAALPVSSQYVELFGAALRCWQPRDGYHFSVDAVLLAMAAFDEPGGSVLELGTGVGVVLLGLAWQRRFTRLVGLELQPALAAYARENAQLNGLEDRVAIVEGDLRAPPPTLSGERFDLIVSNPPYYPVREGHVNPNSQKAIARHEIACCLTDVLAGIRRSLRPDGTAVLVYPAPRTDAVVARAPAAGLRVRELCPVRSRPAYPPRQVLVRLEHALPDAAPPLPAHRPPLDLHGPHGGYAGPLADFFLRLERLATSA